MKKIVTNLYTTPKKKEEILSKWYMFIVKYVRFEHFFDFIHIILWSHWFTAVQVHGYEMLWLLVWNGSGRVNHSGKRDWPSVKILSPNNPLIGSNSDHLPNHLSIKKRTKLIYLHFHWSCEENYVALKTSLGCENQSFDVFNYIYFLHFAMLFHYILTRAGTLTH